MGILIVSTYPTRLAFGAADHTYVACGTGARAWGCWGGKTGGTALRQAAGSTQRADSIAEPNERANIKCYLVNGVCHQSANRILFDAQITVRGARGFSLSTALYGVYGRASIWPCSGPFKQWPGVTGDVAGCAAPAATSSKARSAGSVARGLMDQADTAYLQGVRQLYDAAAGLFETRSSLVAGVTAALEGQRRAIELFHLALFTYQMEFYFGPQLTPALRDNLSKVRLETETEQQAVEQGYATGQLSGPAMVEEMNALTVRFQDRVAEVTTDAEYATLLELRRSERIILADPDITEQVYKR